MKSGKRTSREPDVPKAADVTPLSTDDNQENEGNKKARFGISTPYKVSSRLLSMRASTAKVGIPQAGNGAAVPLKTAVLVNWEAIETRQFDKSKLDSPLQRNFATIESDRAVDILETNETDTPTKVVTKSASKTVLNRTGGNGLYSFFSNHLPPEAKGEVRERMEDDHPFYQTAAFNAVKKSEGNSKMVEAVITAESLKHNNKRTSQASAMLGLKGSFSGSATKYTHALGMLNGFCMEWCHLIAFSFVGKKGQTDKNMLGGTNFANTEMMFTEALVRYFTKIYPGVNVKAVGIPLGKSQVGTYAHYVIQTDDFKLTCKFNLQSILKPHVIADKYMAIFGKVLSTEVEKSAAIAAQQSVTSRAGKRTVFYKMPAAAASTDESIKKEGTNLTAAFESVKFKGR